MTATKTPLTPDQFAQCVQLLEHLLPPGYNLTHTRGTWYVKRWDSWIHQTAGPRMDWLVVDSSRDLATLLGRLGEQP
jgi:hypothetical protein